MGGPCFTIWYQFFFGMESPNALIYSILGHSGPWQRRAGIDPAAHFELSCMLINVAFLFDACNHVKVVLPKHVSYIQRRSNLSGIAPPTKQELNHHSNPSTSTQRAKTMLF